MEPVSFNEPTYGVPVVRGPKVGRITKLAISLGLAKDEKQAQTVLLIVAILFFGAMVAVLLFGGLFSTTPAPSVPIEDIP